MKKTMQRKAYMKRHRRPEVDWEKSVKAKRQYLWKLQEEEEVDLFMKFFFVFS